MCREMLNLMLSLLSDWLILLSPRSHGRPVGSHSFPDVYVLLLLRTVGQTKPPSTLTVIIVWVCLLCVWSWMY